MFATVFHMLLQRSFDDLGVPLSEVTFCVLDLETTGGSPADSEITEVGAIKVRRGESVGTFQTLVNPQQPVPAFIRLLTGISDGMLIEAPDISAVLPNLLEFVRDTVIVAHNARFDISFVNAALVRADYEPLGNRVVDTARLASKILAGEVPNCRLETLARYLRFAHKPCHRAFADVLATTDLLHHLIERATGFGVTTLEDLLALTSTRMDGTFSKIRLCEGLPSTTGVYRFLGGQGQTLYVGKAADLRARVRSYFYGDPRRKIRDLLRQTESIEAECYPTMLEAEIAEARAIAVEMPPHNRAGKKQGAWHVKIATGRAPKVSTARVVKDDGAVYLGPFPSRVARALIDALRDALPIHRCSEPARCHGCAFSEMDRCSGKSDEHREQVLLAARAVTHDPSIVLDALEARMHKLARAERYEEAAEVRERGALLERSLFRSIELEGLKAAGTITLDVSGRRLVIETGCLLTEIGARAKATTRDARVICTWLNRGAEDARLVSCTSTWALPITARPTERFATKKPVKAPRV